MAIRLMSGDEKAGWDRYVQSHAASNVYQLSGWRRVIERTYGHKTFYLVASENGAMETAGAIEGVLPLVHIKHFLFGNSLISTPFFDAGGILANGEETEGKLLAKALDCARELGAGTVELRHVQPLSWASEPRLRELKGVPPEAACETMTHKVRMVLELPESSELLMKSFKSKLRSQIRKPMKEGLRAEIGGVELLEDFYRIYCVNMRDLGSPVHPRRLVGNVLEEFPERAKIVVVRKGEEPLAGAVILGFKDVIANPWASSLKAKGALNANMLLYWSMLEYACDSGHGSFDFGRSTPGGNTYRFKEQWGAKPVPLNWHCFSVNGAKSARDPDHGKAKFEMAIRLWQKLPVPIATAVGSRIRKYIGL